MKGPLDWCVTYVNVKNAKTRLVALGDQQLQLAVYLSRNYLKLKLLAKSGF